MIREKIVEIASSQVGIKEDPAGSNKQKYGVWYGMNGVPWCAIFVSWVYNEAGQKFKADTENGFHYCPSAYNLWKKQEKITIQPQPGDIILYDWEGDKKSDHTGIFVKWIVPGKIFESIEGNTSAGNQSNGGEVQRRRRNLAVVQAFVNILDE